MGRHPQALAAPEPLDGLAVDQPALLAELGVGAPVAPAGMGPAEPAQRLAEGAVPIGLDRPKTLGAAVLPDQPARPPLRHPKHLLEVCDGAAPAQPGSPGSPPELLQRLDLQLLVGHDPLQPGVLALQFLEAFDTSSAFRPPYWARQR